MERYTERLTQGFRFFLNPEFKQNVGDEVFSPDYDDSQWETVRVPHDWAASGEFREENDCSYSAVAADGIRDKIEHSGRTGALPIVGTGYYRKTIFIPAKDEGKRISLIFDGVMWDSHIYVNGKPVFFNHFGYKSFSVDITNELKYGENNLIAVAATVYEDCSRWYPGAGIYRNVYLVKKAPTHIDYNGVWLRTLGVSDASADVECSVSFTGNPAKAVVAVKNPDGNVVASAEIFLRDGALDDIFRLENPVRWDVDHPYLYTAEIALLDENGEVLDNVTEKFGVRTIEFTSDRGFFLNGRRVQIKGVCNHHDLGSLGAAVNVAALRRQLRLMAEMGVNSIRTSHNPPAPELLQLCDEMGFLVMDEFFDEWQSPKVQNGYAKYFKEHAKQDAIDVIRRDRNHPCVILWSIGNEINEQGDKDGWRIAKMLTEVCHQTDPTRPTTAGFNNSWAAFDNHLTDFVDVVGLNYKPHYYNYFHERRPDMKLIGTETASCVSTRGVYHLPAEVEIPAPCTEDLAVSAYELSAPGWAYYPEREFAALDDCPFVAGEYVWTGMDYLGEPTPYYNQWPSRSSYFGVVDIAGIPKNRFWGYMAHWTDKEVLHVFPHWNFNEGETVSVHCYTGYPSAELFVNGKSMGRRFFAGKGGGEIERYRLMWKDVTFEPGEIKVVAYGENGLAKAEKIVRTAGAPKKIVLEADRGDIAADGDDLCYVTASIVDENGTVCPFADNRLYFEADGAWELLTTDAGDQRETESFAAHNKKALSGMCVACLRSLENAGTGRLTVKADGLIPAEIEVICR